MEYNSDYFFEQIKLIKLIAIKKHVDNAIITYKNNILSKYKECYNCGAPIESIKCKYCNVILK